MLYWLLERDADDGGGSAIDGEDVAGDVAGGVGSQEEDWAYYVIDVAPTAERDSVQDLLWSGGVVHQWGVHLCVDPARGYTVDSYPVGCEFCGQVSGHADDRAFGAGVDLCAAAEAYYASA